MVVKPICESNRGWRELGNMVLPLFVEWSTFLEKVVQLRKDARAKGLSNNNHTLSPPWLQENFVILGEITGIPWPGSLTTCISRLPRQGRACNRCSYNQMKLLLRRGLPGNLLYWRGRHWRCLVFRGADRALQCQVSGWTIAPTGSLVSGQTAVTVPLSGQPRFGFMHRFLKA